jgi:hypothetical protein
VPTRAAIAKWARAGVKKYAGPRRAVRARRDARIVRVIQREAKQHGATLANGGKGGIDPRKALEIFRRAKWRCENPNCPTPKKDLDLDHQSGHPKEILEDPEARKDPKARAAAHDPDPKDDDFLHCICRACHDRVHDREREIDAGGEPQPMRGDDRGT